MSYKLTTNAKDENLVEGRTLKTGDIGEIEYCQKTHYVLRTPWGLISLSDPLLFWSDPVQFQVKLCKPGTVLTLTIS